MQITTIGLDIAKNVFQVHGIDAAEKVVVRKQLRRGQILGFFEALPRCLVGMEACATSHYWARELTKLGHQVRLMPAKDVKAYVKRNKNDAADAEAICESLGRSKQAAQEHPWDWHCGCDRHRRHCPGPEGFRSGRDFAAWIGIVPREDSTGGKHKLGPISKRGDQYLRRILVVGAHAVLKRARHQPEKYPWVTRLLERKPFTVVAVAVANKMARVAWALLARGGSYRAPAFAAAA